jgi:hypothetical protein
MLIGTSISPEHSLQTVFRWDETTGSICGNDALCHYAYTRPVALPFVAANHLVFFPHNKVFGKYFYVPDIRQLIRQMMNLIANGLSPPTCRKDGIML